MGRVVHARHTVVEGSQILPCRSRSGRQKIGRNERTLAFLMRNCGGEGLGWLFWATFRDGSRVELSRVQNFVDCGLERGKWDLLLEVFIHPVKGRSLGGNSGVGSLC